MSDQIPANIICAEIIQTGIERRKRKRAAAVVLKRLVRPERLVRRAASRTLKRLKEETVLGPIGPICIEEWRCCVDIIAEEMSKLSNTKVSNGAPKNS